MIINKVSLMNFKSYKNSSISFNKNITIILGQNGAGKSTVLEAINYALFKKYEGNLNDLMRKSTDENENISKMEVNVTFEHNNQIFEVKRGKTKSQSIAELTIKNNDTIIDYIKGDKNVTNEIERRLEIDHDSFENAVYIKQGQITTLIDKTAAEKKKLISKLLNLDNLEKSYKLSLEIINKYKEEISKIEGQIIEEDSLKNKKEELKEIIEENKKQIKKIEENKVEINNNYERLKLEKESLENKKEKLNEITNHIDKLTNEININQKNLDENKNKLSEIEELEGKNKEYERELKQLDDTKEFVDVHNTIRNKKALLVEMNKSIESITALENKLDNNKEAYDFYEKNNKELMDIDEQIKDLNEQVKSYESLNVIHEKTMQDKKDAIEYMKRHIQKVNNIFDNEFRSVDAIYEEYNKNIQENNENLDNLEKSLNELKLKNNEYQSIIKNTTKSLEELEKTTDKCPICQSDISHKKHEELSADYRKTISECEENIKENNLKITKITNKKEEIQKNIDLIETIPIAELKLKDEERKDLSEQYHEEQIKLDEYKKYADSYNELKEKYENINKQNDEIKDKYLDYISAKKSLESFNKDELNGKIENINDEINDLRKKLLELKSRIKITDDIERRIKYLENMREEYNRNNGIISAKDNILQNIESMNNNLTIRTNEVDNYKKEIIELEYDDKKHQKVNEEYIKTEEIIKENEITFTRINTQLVNDEKIYDETIEKLKSISELNVEKQQKTQLLKFLTQVRELYGKDGIQKELRNKVRPLIESNATNIFKDFEFDYDSIKLDENYDISVTRADEIFDIKQLSGGENIIIALAIRLAIAKTISQKKSEFMILDEPTVHLDEERIENLIESLRNTQIASQLFIVTHESAMMNISSNIVEVTKVNGISSFKT